MILRLKIYLSQARDTLSREAHADKYVMEAYDAFVFDLVRSRQEGRAVTEAEIYRIIDAAEFASGKHQNQTRRNLEHTPYIVHPLRVAHHLLMTGHIEDADILMAALLHDTIEDTKTTLEELRRHFGYRVQRLVQELSDDKSMMKEDRKRMQIKNASQKSEEAALIVLADKLSNLTDLLENPPTGWDSERISNYFLWAQEVIKYLPYANPFLLNAVEEVIESYWQGLAEKEYGE